MPAPIDVRQLTEQVQSAEQSFENLFIKIGTVIMIICVILGIYIVASTLYKSGTAEHPQESKGMIKKIIVGSALIVFSTIIGIIIATVYKASTGG